MSKARTLLKVDNKTVAYNPTEKDVLFFCLRPLIPQMKYMSSENIKKWILDAVRFAFADKLHHKRIKSLISNINRISDKNILMQQATELILRTEGIGRLHGFKIGNKFGDRTNFDAEKISIQELKNRGY